MKKKIDIAIVGAGLAGLTTAYLLLTKPIISAIEISLTLFEASPRLGGRVYTLRNFEQELYAEAGAISIGNGEEDILSLVKELNVKLTQRSDRQQRRYFIDGKWQTQTDITTMMIFIIQELKNLQAKGVINEENDWISVNPKQKILDDLDEMTITEFLEKAVKEKRLILQNPQNLSVNLSASLLGHYASDVGSLSAFDALRFMSQYQNTSCAYSVENGNELLITTLYQRIQDRCKIMLNTPVSQVAIDQKNKMSVSVQSGEVQKHFTFDYVIMAVPLSSLQVNQQSIKFKPPLPPQKHDAINQLSYNTSVARIYYELESKFWLADHPETAMAITDQATVWIEDHTAHISNKDCAVLEVHAGGPIGQEIIETECPEDLAAKQIEHVYGDQFRQALSHKKPISFFWSKEPYQQGAYPFFKPGQRKYLERLGESVGNIFFAGEYTSIGKPASMNGAVCSANRAFFELSERIKNSFTVNKYQSVSVNNTLST